MALGSKQIVADPRLLFVIKQQSAAFLEVNQHSSRLTSVFSTQHRWLMAHIGLSLYFTSIEQHGESGGLIASRFMEKVRAWDVASRNTAAAFLNEMVYYGVIALKDNRADRRMKIYEPSQETLATFDIWLRIHAQTLDALDGGGRLERYNSIPGVMARLQPLIADDLLQHALIREPSEEFAHFMGVSNGFLLTERLIVGAVAPEQNAPHTLTQFQSIQELALGVNLSRSHTARTIQEAEKLGILGWTGAKGRSSIWVSKRFIDTFLAVQAAKLAIIDDAFSKCIGEIANVQRRMGGATDR